MYGFGGKLMYGFGGKAIKGFSLEFFITFISFLLWQTSVKWTSSQNLLEPFSFKEFNLCNKHLAFSWEAFPFKMSNYMWRTNFHLEAFILRIFLIHNLGRTIFSSSVTFFFFFFAGDGGVSLYNCENCLTQTAKVLKINMGSNLNCFYALAVVCSNFVHVWALSTESFYKISSSMFIWKLLQVTV